MSLTLVLFVSLNVIYCVAFLLTRCLDGWISFRLSCYLFYDVIMNFRDAEVGGCSTFIFFRASNHVLY